MLLNLFGIFWSVIVINIFNMIHTSRKPPGTLLHFMKTLTCQQGKTKQEDRGKDIRKLSHISDDLNTEECQEKLVYRNIFEIQRNERNAKRMSNKFQEINMDLLHECENYVREWRVLARACDKVLCLCVVILTTVTALIIVLPHYE